MHDAAAQAAVEHGDLQTPFCQIPDAKLTSCGITPGKLRDQQFRQCEENGCREHQNREHHAAHSAESSQRCQFSREERQPFWHHQILCGRDTSFQIVCQCQGERSSQQPGCYRNSWTFFLHFPQPQNPKTYQCETGADAAAQNHRLTGPFGVCACP